MRRTSSLGLPIAALLLVTACADEERDAPGPSPTGVARMERALGVPGDFPTLPAAIDAAADGEAIELAPGDYEATATLRRAITIRGAGAGATVVRGSLTVEGAAEVALADLTLEGGGGGTGIGGVVDRLTIEGCAIRGFLRGVAASGGQVVVQRSIIAGNAWGVELTDAGGVIASNEIRDNTHGGVVTRGASDVAVVHNTVVGNGFAGAPEQGAGGVAAGPGGAGRWHGNVVVGNRYGLNCQQCGVVASHNAVWGNIEGYVGDSGRAEGDVDADPLFVDPAGGDFRLRAGSPCIDAGPDLAALMLDVPTDFAGLPRVIGGTPDLGAHEYAPPLLEVVVNEVMANPLDEATGEFVEIVNRSDGAVDLAGFILDDGDAPDVLVAYEGGPTIVPPGGYAVVLDPDYAGEYAIPPEAVRLTVADRTLGNALAIGDAVRLILPDGVTVASSYPSPFDPGNGVSAERIAPDGPDAWTASPCGSTPGAPNCAAAPPVVEPLLITEVMANAADEGTGEFVEILNRGPDPIDLAGYVLSDGDADDVLEGVDGGPTLVPPGGYAVVLDRDYAGEYAIPADAVRLTAGDRRLGNSLATDDPVTLRDRTGELVAAFSWPFDPGNGRSAEMVDLDVGNAEGNWVAAACVEPPFASPGAPNCASAAPPVEVPTLVINEVMANALDEDTGEFVELYNEGEVPVDAKDLVLFDGDAADVLRAFGEGSTLVPPGGYAVVLDPEYAGLYAIPADAVLLRPDDTTIGSGLATTDPLELRAADGVTVVSTFSSPFNPGNGISAERIADRGDVPGNWTASPCPARSSPGRRNCASAGPDEPPGPVEPPAVVINEVMANPLDEATGEFVELLNEGDAPVDLAGFVLFDGDGTDRLVAWEGGPTTVAPGGFAVLVDPDYAGDYPIEAGAVRLTAEDRALGTGLAVSDPITLLMPDGATVVDAWRSPFDPGDGTSAERTLPPDGGPPAWVPSTCPDPQRSSPGRPNCAPPPLPPDAGPPDAGPPDAGPPDAAPDAGPRLLPDLVIDADRILASARIDEQEFRPESCALFEGCILEPGRRKLPRFDVETANVGTADLVMGSPNDNPDLFEWSPCHRHFHFNDYARYALLDAEGNAVAPGHKQSFCLLDSRRVLDDPDVSDRGQFHCGRQGISRGWSDVYGAGLDCQWIDITDVPPGRYRIRVEVNFNQVLPELDYENNVVEVEFTIPNDDITVPCAAGEPPGPDRDCGWTLAETIVCEPGDRVAVGCADACELGTCQGDPVLRVCPGDGRPCFADEALGSADDACGTTCPRAEGTCPLDGAVTVFTGPGADAPFVCDLESRVRPPPPPTDPCPDFGTGPRRECGWQVATDADGPIRGRACDPGATLVIGCNPAPTQCGDGVGVTCVGDPMLRICAGDAECRYDAAVATNDDACGGNLCPETDFVCPEAGAYTVLTAPYSNGNDFTCDVAVVPAP